VTLQHFEFDLGAAGRRLTLGGAPEGHDARVLCGIARTAGKPILHIALDDSRAAKLIGMLAFFDGDLPVTYLPAWDCLPYDRVSPHGEIVARRVVAMTEIDRAIRYGGPHVVVTTVNAALQRLPPREAIVGASFAARVGDKLDIDAMQAFATRNGYSRAQTVREPGEYAIRGDIVDLFPPSNAEPIRVDLFGDEVEQIRSFDPLSQRTTGRLDALDLRPMAELFLDEESIARFRQGYRAAFGAVTDEDPLYEAVSAGRRYAGMEHWLPLFHERLDTVFDQLGDAPVTLDHQADHAVDARLTQIADFHDARITMQATEKRANAPVYKPLDPAQLYLTDQEWRDALAGRPVGELSPFAAPRDADGVVDALGRRSRDFAEARAAREGNLYDAVKAYIGEQQREGRTVLVAGYTEGARDRLRALLREHGVASIETVDGADDLDALEARQVGAAVLAIEHGVLSPDAAIITESDILGDRLTRAAPKRRRSDQFIAEVSALREGDYVVHTEHGIGRYDGLETLSVSGAPHDCLKLVYAENAKLYLPVENIELLSRFGSEDIAVQLDKLGGAAWQARKSKVKKRLKDLADELMKIAAARALREGEAIAPPEGSYEEFVARFPYPETDDQLGAIEDVLTDLQSGKPMDRLVCGDVGFGKTEVALRAAFVVALSGRQVAIVVPTTLLARQHFKSFTERFQGLPVRVEQLSRMVPAKDQKAIKSELADGSVDIVIGTHALLGKEVKFRDLGMMIIDEEQHFGVKQKEKLKQFKANTHVLTLTATPIPRTLQMSLSGVRELSLITTPPIDRLAVRTFVLPFDPMVVREAIMREHFRGGQTYYVCPRIEDLDGVREQLEELVPEVRIVVAHGRMAPTQLEEVMGAFYDGKFDVLLCTSIVESGLDVPSANTIVLHRADMFGLATLYQLRGRIGRSKVRGYAYLTYQPDTKLNQTAQQRLHVIETLDTLGAGFSLASHDMDIRGAGNLLGEEQSGHIREVGVELYQQMLEEAVANARGEGSALAADEAWTPNINLGLPVLIPEDYVADLQVRLDLYRRIARLVDQQEIEGFAAELIDRFGPLPQEVENLLALVGLKRLCREAGVDRVDAGPRGAVIGFRGDVFAEPERLIQFIGQRAGTVKVRPDQRLVLVQGWDDPEKRLTGVRRFIGQLADLANGREAA
jgi:transcription-repair coupling factor (superfamily II helicase)